jgi:hypothetical protein
MVIILPGFSGILSAHRDIGRVPHSFRVRCGMGGLIVRGSERRVPHSSLLYRDG